MNVKFLRLFLSAFFLAWAAALTQGAPPAQDKPVVKIGVIVPLSGNMAHTGEGFRDAVRMALEEQNPNNRFRYEAVFEDDGLESRKVAVAAQKLIHVDKVDALISTWSYGGSVVAPIAQRSKIINFSTAWDPTIARGAYNFLYLTPPRVFLPLYLDVFARKGYKRINAIGWKEAGSVFCLREMERLAKERGMEVVQTQTVLFGEKDFRTLLLKTLETKPDVYFVNLGNPELALLKEQMRQLRITTPMTIITGLEVVQDLAPFEGYWYVSDTYVPGDFEDQFRKRYGTNEIYSVGNYYDVTRLLMFAYEKAGAAHPGGKPSNADVLPFLQNPDGFRSIFGPIRFDAEGIVQYPAQLLVIRQGKRVPVTIEALMQ